MRERLGGGLRSSCLLRDFDGVARRCLLRFGGGSVGVLGLTWPAVGERLAVIDLDRGRSGVMSSLNGSVLVGVGLLCGGGVDLSGGLLTDRRADRPRGGDSAGSALA